VATLKIIAILTHSITPLLCRTGTNAIHSFANHTG
jgi:hypothetical protein